MGERETVEAEPPQAQEFAAVLRLARMVRLQTSMLQRSWTVVMYGEGVESEAAMHWSNPESGPEVTSFVEFVSSQAGWRVR